MSWCSIKKIDSDKWDVFCCSTHCSYKTEQEALLGSILIMEKGLIKIKEEIEEKKEQLIKLLF